MSNMSSRCPSTRSTGARRLSAISSSATPAQGEGEEAETEAEEADGITVMLQRRPSH